MAIVFKNVKRRRGWLNALDGFSLTIPDGQIFGLIGPNGAGKTTAVKLVCQLDRHFTGTVKVLGKNLPDPGLKRRLGYMPQEVALYSGLTVHENLDLFGELYMVPTGERERRERELLVILDLRGRENSLVRELSGGMKRRLSLACAMIHEPELLLLDEPASGMDPRGRSELVKVLKEENRKGTTILISSHILTELQDLCTSVGVMEVGRLVGIRSLTGDARTDITRRVVLLVTGGDLHKAENLLKQRENVSQVEIEDDHILIETVDSDDAVADVVRYLVQEDVHVLLPQADTVDLKGIFLKMTKGDLT